MHLLRSAFIALAVKAMIGRSLNRSIRRTARMVSYPSISGIMMSINTTSTSGFWSSVSMPAGDLPADREAKSCAAVFAAGRTVSLLERLEDHPLFFKRDADTGVDYPKGEYLVGFIERCGTVIAT